VVEGSPAFLVFSCRKEHMPSVLWWMVLTVQCRGCMKLQTAISLPRAPIIIDTRTPNTLPVSAVRHIGVLWCWAEIMMVIIKEARVEMQPAAQFQDLPAALYKEGG